MEFTLPTTQSQMYSTLNSIFNFYRIRRPEYNGITLQPLSLQNMSYSALTDAQLSVKAEGLLAPELEKEKINMRAELTATLGALNLKLEALNESSQENVSSIEQMYDASTQKLREQAIKNGLINSSVFMDKFTFLENERISKIDKINSNRAERSAEIEAQILQTQNALDNIDEYFEQVHSLKISAKVLELKDEQAKIQREVFKYNNSISEKMQKYANDITKSNASLVLRYMEIKAIEYTKDQLIEMGYYEDVVRCVCGYYDRLAPITAYQTLSKDKKAAIYLEEYFQTTVYMYGVLSGMIS